MALENATTYAELQASDPKKTDPKNQGDDHLRMLKRVHKNIWKGIGGDGYAIPIEALEQDLNNLTGTTGNIQTQITNNADDIVAGAGALSGLENSLNVLNQIIADLEKQQNFCNGLFAQAITTSRYNVVRHSVGDYTVTMTPAPVGNWNVVATGDFAIVTVSYETQNSFRVACVDFNFQPIDNIGVNFQVGLVDVTV